MEARRTPHASRSKGWAACKHLSNESVPYRLLREAGLVCLHACEAPSGQREGEVGKMTAMIPSSLPKAMWTKRIIESHSSNQTHTFLAPIMSTDSVATAALSSPVWKHSGSHAICVVLDRLLRHCPWRTDHEFKQCCNLHKIMTVTTCLLTYVVSTVE